MTADELKEFHSSIQNPLGAAIGAYGAYDNGNQTLDQIARSSANADQQIQSLQDLYSPNGVAAQQMKEAVMRQAAAKGRNSQVGYNMANWAAQLAPHQAQTAQAIQGLNAQRASLQGLAAQTRAQQTGAYYNLANAALSSPYGQKAVDWAGGQLKDLWHNYGPQDPQGGNTSSYSAPNFDARGGYGDYAPQPDYQSNGGAGQMYGPQEPSMSQADMNSQYQGMGSSPASGGQDYWDF